MVNIETDDIITSKIQEEDVAYAISELEDVSTDDRLVEFNFRSEISKARSWCSAPWMRTTGNYTSKKYANQVKYTATTYTYLLYLAGFTDGDTKNGGDTNRAKVKAPRSNVDECGYAQVKQNDGDIYEGLKVCTSPKEDRISTAAAPAQRGPDYNSYITLTK